MISESTQYTGKDGVQYSTKKEAIESLGYFVCPKCNGEGHYEVTYNSYPTGFPDSGFVYTEGKKDEKCSLCITTGYTSKKMKPKMVQQGWEEDV